jgi:hypothetical protein
MGSELIHAIRTEIERVEAELDKQKAALKHCEQSGALGYGGADALTPHPARRAPPESACRD